MKTQLILLDTPIIVSDEKHKKDDFIIHKFFWKKREGHNGISKCKDNSGSTDEWWNKIIAGLPELPQIDFNGFEEQLGIVDVEKLSEKFMSSLLIKNTSDEIKYGFMEGFKAAQKLNEKKFSLADIEEAVNVGLSLSTMTDEPFTSNIFKVLKKSTIDGWVNSLSQPKVFDIEVEIEKGFNGEPRGEMEFFERPKITNNSIKIIKVL